MKCKHELRCDADDCEYIDECPMFEDPADLLATPRTDLLDKGIFMKESIDGLVNKLSEMKTRFKINDKVRIMRKNKIGIFPTGVIKDITNAGALIKVFLNVGGRYIATPDELELLDESVRGCYFGPMVNSIVELCRILEREGDALRIANKHVVGTPNRKDGGK